MACKNFQVGDEMNTQERFYEFVKCEITEGHCCDDKDGIYCSYCKQGWCHLFNEMTRGIRVGRNDERNGKVEMCKIHFKEKWNYGRKNNR